MLSDREIRRATPGDVGDLLSIYRPIAANTATSFELEPPTEEEFAHRIEIAGESHAWLVAEVDSRLAGYAYATQYRPRGAYKYSVETSAYVHAGFRGKRIGARLYERLFEVLRVLGYCHAFAGITLPNAASVALHKSVGFSAVGTFPNAGYKFGSWHDVSWWHRTINDSGARTLAQAIAGR